MTVAETVVVSACLLGENCKYNGGNNLNKTVQEMVNGRKVIPVCPEVLGGLGCPRVPCEIVNGRVMTKDGRDVDSRFRKGALLALEEAKKEGASLAILQGASPSCGAYEIHDGSFSGKLVPGSGVFASLLSENGIRTLDAFEIRKAVPSDLERIMEIYAQARVYMAQTGNPDQWGPRNWPPESLIREDIEKSLSYVCCRRGKTVGVFYYDYGKDIEPTYREIDNGHWLDDSPYGVVHRIATDVSVKGAGSFCIEWAYAMSGHLRIDTHEDNKIMQHILEKSGFTRTGIIYVYEDRYPRFAYERI